MNKGIRKVRRSIAQRNKTKSLRTKNEQTKQIISPFPQEEEKHGYIPSYIDTPFVNKQKRQNSGIILKGVLSVALFLGANFLLKTELELFSKPKQWTTYALMEDFPFARVSAWYQEAFGTPLAFTPVKNQTETDNSLLAMPVNGNVTETFQSNGEGIMITPMNDSSVNAWHDGVVIFAGNNRHTNKTIIIQHPDNSKSTYGYLSSVDVHLYQLVSANQRIGRLDPQDKHDTVYFSIEKDQQFVDPVQVIEVDDSQ